MTNNNFHSFILSFVLNRVMKLRVLSQTLFVYKMFYPKQSLRVVSNPQRLTSSQILVEYRPTHPGLTVPNLKWITHQPTYTKKESRNSFD